MLEANSVCNPHDLHFLARSNHEHQSIYHSSETSCKKARSFRSLQSNEYTYIHYTWLAVASPVPVLKAPAKTACKCCRLPHRPGIIQQRLVYHSLALGDRREARRPIAVHLFDHAHANDAVQQCPCCTAERRWSRQTHLVVRSQLRYLPITYDDSLAPSPMYAFCKLGQCNKRLVSPSIRAGSEFHTKAMAPLNRHVHLHRLGA